MNKRKKTSIVWTIEKEKLQKILNSSSTISEILFKLGYNAKTGNTHKQLTKRIKDDKLNLKKFQKNNLKYVKEMFQKLTLKNSKPLNEIFCQNSTYTSGKDIKRKLFKYKNWHNECNICKNNGMWLGKPISLELDHINGIHNDNRLENLRLLCPNCHSQTDTHCGKNLKKRN